MKLDDATLVIENANSVTLFLLQQRISLIIKMLVETIMQKWRPI